MSDKSSSGGGGGSGCGCFGCLGFIAFVLVGWALLFGWSVDGRHYSLGLSCDRGVTVESER